MTPQKLGRYEVTGVLGQGAMGIVYKGIDPKIGRTVALKTLRSSSDFTDTQFTEFKRRFAQEAQSAGRLAHPNIVTIYDVGEEGDMSFIAMELVEGHALDDLIAQKHAFSVDDIVRIMVQICEGLAYAHRQQVIHRDIKPANIIIANDGSAKIMDFGIAKFASSTATQTGMVVGTPSYMSPEQITGKAIDHRSDIFSLGAVFYELLTCEKAFPGDNVTTVMYRVVHENPTPVSVINMTVPAQFGMIVQKAMAKNPTDRYATANDMARDIQGHKTLAIQQMGATQVMSVPDLQATLVMPANSAGATAVLSKPTVVVPKNRQWLWIGGFSLITVLAVLYFVLQPFSRAEPRLGRGTASLDLTLNTLEGVVYLDSVPFTVVNSRIRIPEVSASEHDLLVTHDGYQPYRTKLLFAENETKSFSIDLQLSPLVIPEGVDTAYLSITSVPEVIKVMTTTGRLIGYTPLNRTPYPAGKHSFVFSRQNYVNQVIDADLKKSREIRLRPILDYRKGPVSVAALSPPDAQILINEVAYPVDRGGKLVYLPVGKQSIVIRKNGFRTVEKEIAVTEKDTARLDVQLEPVFGILRVSSEPVGADVFLNGKKLGQTPLLDSKFPVGNHEIRIQKGNLYSTKRITIDENKETATHANLQASLGIVRLLINPWANVYVDGKKLGVTPPLDNIELKPGEYSLKIENPAFSPVTKKISVKAGATVTVQHDFK